MPSPPLRIALIEPDPACAAELGQMLSDTLRDFSIELSDTPAADLILMDQAVLAPAEPWPGPTIVFGRSSDGTYSAQVLLGSGASGPRTLAFRMPLTDGIRYASLFQCHRQHQTAPTGSDRALAPELSHRLQQRLLQVQKMDAVSELAGGIAHDFNNLLLVIRSYTEMLLEDAALSPTTRHYAHQILGASQRAADLTGELLAFSRRQPQPMRPSCLNETIDRAVPMLSRLVGRHIVVWVKLPPELWPIQANAEQLEQILINLAVNARDAMPRGGKLLLETSNVLIEDKHAAMPPGNTSCSPSAIPAWVFPNTFCPASLSPSLPPKSAAKVPDSGWPPSTASSSKAADTIWAYSEPGYGTTFKLYMPRAAAAMLTPDEAAPQLAARAASAGSA